MAGGYVAVPAHASPDSAEGLVSAWRESFAAYAGREGYCLGSVFADLRGRDERGLYELAQYLRRDGVIGVVVPDVAHLTHVRALSGADWRTAQRHCQDHHRPDRGRSRGRLAYAAGTERSRGQGAVLPWGLTMTKG